MIKSKHLLVLVFSFFAMHSQASEQSHSAGESVDYVQPVLLQTAQNSGTSLSCTCKALDAAYDVVCRSLPTTQCGKVGSIICYPVCTN